MRAKTHREALLSLARAVVATDGVSTQRTKRESFHAGGPAADETGTYDTRVEQAELSTIAEFRTAATRGVGGGGSVRPNQNETALHQHGVGASAKAPRIIAIHTACHVLHNRHAGGDHAGGRGAAAPAAGA